MNCLRRTLSQQAVDYKQTLHDGVTNKQETKKGYLLDVPPVLAVGIQSLPQDRKNDGDISTVIDLRSSVEMRTTY